MPGTPIIDAHLHLWDPARLPMAWLAGNQLLERPYGLAEYAQHTAGLDVAAMVYLQVDVAPAYALIEARAIAELAVSEPRLAGIVAYAPLEDGRLVRAYLDALTAIGPLVKGVRRITQGEADPAFCLRPGFVAGVRQLADYGLSCDLCIYHPQLAATTELVRRCPEVQFMLDHIGKPDIRGGQLEPWRAQLAELAGLPNVLCKISGVATEADHAAWTPDQLAPYIAHALDVFGEDRVVFGGDWPVLLLAAPYTRWVETLDGLTAAMGEPARRKLWAENARRFYRLHGMLSGE
jgi:L-fuconolactonase